MRTFFRLLLGLPIFLAGQALMAQEADAPLRMDLRSCVRYALENATEVRQARLQAERDRLEVAIERKRALPSIDLSSRLVYNFARPVDIAPGNLFGDPTGDRPIRFGKAIEGGIGLEGRLPVYDRSRAVGKSALAPLEEINDLRQVLSQEEIALEVAKTYLQALSVQEKAALLQANLDRIIQLQELTRRQVENGFAKPQNVDRLRVAQQNLEVNRRNLELQYSQLLQALQFRMGMPYETGLQLVDSVRREELPAPQSLHSEAPIDNRTQLRLLELRSQLDEVKIDRIAAGASPVVSIWGGIDLVAWGDNPAQWLRTDYWYGASFLGLRLDYPLLGGPLRQAQIERARIEQALGDETLARTRRGLQLQHDAAWTTLNVKYNELESLDRNRQLAEEVYALTRREYAEGLTPVMDLLSTELAAREAQVNYLTALIEAKTAYLEWLNANGRLLDHFNLPRQ